VPLNACFAAITALRDEGIASLVSLAIQRLFEASGVGGVGASELLW
jgi:hypothetical protein